MIEIANLSLTLNDRPVLRDISLRLTEKRIAIVGACYSGGFIPIADGEPNRAVITSASADEQSFKGPEEADGIRTGELFIESLSLVVATIFKANPTGSTEVT